MCKTFDCHLPVYLFWTPAQIKLPDMHDHDIDCNVIYVTEQFLYAWEGHFGNAVIVFPLTLIVFPIHKTQIFYKIMMNEWLYLLPLAVKHMLF